MMAAACRRGQSKAAIARSADAAATRNGIPRPRLYTNAKAAPRHALETVKAPTTRGEYRFGPNHYPEQAYYLREVVKNADGSVSNKYIGKVADKLVDTYVAECKMK